MLAGLGLAIAAVGIYGVTARSVEERTREVGVRLALGARPSSVWRLVVGQAMTAVAAGMAVGGVVAMVAASAVLVRLAARVGAQRRDGPVVPALLLLTIVTVVPPRFRPRARSTVNPVVALRRD